MGCPPFFQNKSQLFSILACHGHTSQRLGLLFSENVTPLNVWAYFFSKMSFSVTPRCSCLLWVWVALGCFGCSRLAFGYSGLLWTAMGCSGVLWGALGCSVLIWAFCTVLGCSGLLWVALGCFGMLWGLCLLWAALGCSGLLWAALVHKCETYT